MDFKTCAVFFVVACQLCFALKIPLLERNLLEGRFASPALPPNCTLAYYRTVYSSFPCSDRLLVNRMFDALEIMRAPVVDGRIESEEAEMDLLHLMIFGKSSSVSLTRWYLLLEKAIEALDKDTMKTEKQSLNEQILRNYLTPAQLKRLHIFTRLFEPDSRPYHTKVLLTYLYGVPAGLALGVSEEEISVILEKYESTERVAIELAKSANRICSEVHPHGYEYSENIVRDLLRVMFTHQTA